MTLYETLMENCTMLDRNTVSDGLGGFIETYTDGAQFLAAVGKDSTIQGRIAEKQGVTEIYTITTYKSVRLHFHDVFRREKDGQIFRVTSNVEDNETPAVATFDMAQVSAEVWQLPR